MFAFKCFMSWGWEQWEVAFPLVDWKKPGEGPTYWGQRSKGGCLGCASGPINLLDDTSDWVWGRCFK